MNLLSVAKSQDPPFQSVPGGPPMVYGLFMAMEIVMSSVIGFFNGTGAGGTFPFTILLKTQTRKEIREHYHLKGSSFGSCCAYFWCGPCALAQDVRELAYRAERMHPPRQIEMEAESCST